MDNVVVDEGYAGIEEGPLEGRMDVVAVLDRAARMVDMTSFANALGVSFDVADRYVSGELVYPEDEESLDKLRVLEEMCDSLGDGAVAEEDEDGIGWDEGDVGEGRRG